MEHTQSFTASVRRVTTKRSQIASYLFVAARMGVWSLKECIVSRVTRDPTTSVYWLFNVLLLPAVIAGSLRAESPTGTAGIEFFEARIRPVLTKHCYSCHNSISTSEGGLALDHRQAVLKGGDNGAIIEPGNVQSSRLLAVLKHEIDGLEMPLDSPKLSDTIIRDFSTWIEIGAPDPRDTPPSEAEIDGDHSWPTIFATRRQWWSFQPLQSPTPPEVGQPDWEQHPVDQFIYQRLHEAGLTPAPLASPPLLVRRLYFALIGIPPAPDELITWTTRLRTLDQRARKLAIDELIAELMARPQFGERWARHWMDWIRYAESHGSEGDPNIGNAAAYRDYLIRAWNEDVGYDQLVREHIAGDLLDSPRTNETLGINESIIGTAHWRMVFHGFAPTDALEEKVRFVDDQINVFSKAFLGLTVSCARCHDHKFDPISQRDYYAFFGILASCRPGRHAIQLPAIVHHNRELLVELKPRIRAAIAADWLASAPQLRERLLTIGRSMSEPPDAKSLLYPLFIANHRFADVEDFSSEWLKFVQGLAVAPATQSPRAVSRVDDIAWDFADSEAYRQWFIHGAGLPSTAYAAGEFSVAVDPGQAITGIYPRGVYTHAISNKHGGRLTSPDIALEENQVLWVQAIGDPSASLRYVVQDFPRDGTVYPVRALTNQWQWHSFDVSYWSGDRIHIELATAMDAPLLIKDQSRSWFGVRKAMILKQGQAPDAVASEPLAVIFDAVGSQPIASVNQLADTYRSAICKAINDWQSECLSDQQALLLDACIREGLLVNAPEALPSAQPLLETYRQLEAEIPTPQRVPGLDEDMPEDHPLFQRGDHRRPLAPVPRGFLEALSSRTYEAHGSGRLGLAEDVLSESNPLPRRVIVNRVWQHLFGQGIVTTPDNLGRLGNPPSHPELLDWLATRFIDDGWSLKSLIRLIVTSRTWQLDSTPSADARRIDPENRLLSHAHLRRLEAEAIRDALLSVSGQLDHQAIGEPPSGQSPRRSVYLRVQRNSLNPFLRVFDFPEPFSTTGRRDSTNVPAQSLAMLNAPEISAYAQSWAQTLLQDSDLTTDRQKIDRMFLQAFSREAAEPEMQRVLAYVAETRDRLNAQAQTAARLDADVLALEQRLRDLLNPKRDQFIAATRDEGAERAQVRPRPIGRWDFAGDFNDSIGAAHGTQVNGAMADDGALVVSNSSYVITAPLPQPLAEKTLEVWVQLDDLEQRGAGIMTVQSRDGVIFDAIVFGEQAPKRWLAGSNNFQRTQSFDGPVERLADAEPIHFAIAYDKKGRIQGFRNGMPYGQPYLSRGVHEFSAHEAIVGFGIRHLPAGGNRMLSGRLLRAQLYDRALSPDEVLRSYRSAPESMTDRVIIEQLSDAESQTVHRLKQELDDLRTEQRAHRAGSRAGELTVWAELARALFTFKEFLYVQ